MALRRFGFRSRPRRGKSWPLGMTQTRGFVEGLRFVGRSEGAVRTLSGFQKSRHTVPAEVNATTQAFLVRLAEEELREEAEALFQKARTALGYKRKDLALDLGAGTATLTARDFTWELTYALSEADPAHYVGVRTLHHAQGLDFLRGGPCGEVFARQFSELVFGLTRGAPVEAVIDAVEGLDEAMGLRVNYPSDCRDCVLSVEGVEAQVRFDGSDLAMVFPRAGSPGELLEGFLAVRSAFQLSKAPILAGLVGVG